MKNLYNKPIDKVNLTKNVNTIIKDINEGKKIKDDMLEIQLKKDQLAKELDKYWIDNNWEFDNETVIKNFKRINSELSSHNIDLKELWEKLKTQTNKIIEHKKDKPSEFDMALITSNEWKTEL